MPSCDGGPRVCCTPSIPSGVGVLLFAIVALVLRKTVVAPQWPFCARCNELRSRRIKTGLGLLGGAVAVLIVSTTIAVSTTSDDIGATSLVIGNLLFVAGIVAGVVVLGQSAWRAVAGAVVSADGLWVTVSKSSPAFAERAATAAQLSRGGARPAPTAH